MAENENTVEVDTEDTHLRFRGRANFCDKAGPAVEVFPDQGFDPLKSVTCEDCKQKQEDDHITFQNDVA